MKVHTGSGWVSIGSSITREDIEALGFVPGSHTTPPTAGDIEALGFVTGSHTGAPSVGDVEALGFVTGAHSDIAALLRSDGTTPLAGDWDVAGHELLNIVIQNAASDSAPTDPSAGQLWWDTDEGQLNVFDGGEWSAVGILATQEDIEGLGFVPGSHTAAPTAEDVESLGFSPGDHTPTPTREDIEALGFVPGTPDLSGLDDINLDLLSSVMREESIASDTPIVDPQAGAPVESSLDFNHNGSVRSMSVTIDISHSDFTELTKLRHVTPR